MRSHGFSRILDILNQKGLGKRPLKIMEDRASEAIQMGDLHQDGFGAFYSEYWSDRIPEEAKRDLFIEHDKCWGCGSPVLDEAHDGYRGTYCCPDCCEQNEEYIRHCHNCGDEYDSEETGGWLFDNDYCSTDCAWDAVRGDLRTLAYRRGYDPEETIRNIRMESDQAPWYESERQMRADVEAFGVYTESCGSCGDTVRSDDGYRVRDLDETYCSEECAWKAIKRYAKDDGLNDKQIGALLNFHLVELSSRGWLDSAISAIKGEEE